MALQGAVTLRVTPLQLREAAREISDEIRAMKNLVDGLDGMVSRTSHFWTGAAGDQCRALYEDDKEQIAEMLRRLEEHPRDLLQMAQIYKDVEQKAAGISMALPESVIE